MGLVLVLLGSFVFGAIDQYLGGLWSSSHLGFWTIDLSAMSAPWLALPFAIGSIQTRSARAAILGLAVTVSALAGYFVMTLSPLEGVNLATVGALGFIRSQLHVIVPGLVSGPIFGWLGYQWRTSRSWLSAALVAGAFCLEPLARTAYGQPFQFAGVAAGEILVGIVVATYFARIGLKDRRRAQPR